MRRRVVQIFELTSAVGGALDTGVLDVEEFEAIIVGVHNHSIANASAGGYHIGESDDVHLYRSISGIGANDHDHTLSIGPGRSGNVEMVPGPTRRMKWIAQAPVGGTVHMEIHGVKYEE